MGKRKRYGKETRKEPEERPINTKALLVVALLVVGVGIYVIGGRGSNESSKIPVTQQSLALPDYAYTNAKTLKAYTAAVRIPEVFEKIPCYCGCVAMAHLDRSHQHLRDCFIFDDGTYDAHAAYCDLCVAEALDVLQWYEEGVPLVEIRSRIEKRYGGGRFGEGTKTPPLI